MAVSIPGVLLSSLMFEMKNSPGDTVGILLGTTLRYSVSTISDTESCGTREERKICVQEYELADIGGISSFTDKKHKVDFNKLEEKLNGRLEDVVGWLRYRCNSSHNMSLLEKATHRSLKEGLPQGPGGCTDLVFGLFTEQTPDDPGLHTLEHSFWQWIGSAPQLVHVDIVNLKSTSTMPYHLTPIAPPPSSLNIYHELLNTDKQSLLLTEKGESVHADAMNRLLVEFQEKFNPLKDELLKSFNEIQSLQEHIDSINSRLDQANSRTKETTTATTSIDNSTDTDCVPPLISFDDVNPSSSPQPLSLPSNSSDDNCTTDHYGNNAILTNTDLPLINGMKPPLIPTEQLDQSLIPVLTDTNAEQPRQN